MSLILDALKKSEAERQRGQVPNLLSPLPSTPSQVPTRKTASWPLLVVVAVLLAALVIGYFYTRPGQVETPVSAALPTNQAPTQNSEPVTENVVAAPAPPATKPAPAPIEKPATAMTETTAPVLETPQTAPELPQAPVQTSTETRIAGMSEMPVDQRQQLPALKLSMHVYSSEPGKRFAIIDGQRVNEGSALGSAVVEEIRQDGVVLSVQGQSYLLPRP